MDAGQKHLAAKAGAGTWKHVQPPTNLYLEADYERRHIAELHQKLDDAMVSLAEAYKQRDGAKRHKQVMIQIATPKHRPKRRQKQLRKAADARIEAATREGDATISKMQENVLTWKGTSVSMFLLLVACSGSTQLAVPIGGSYSLLCLLQRSC